MTKLFDFFAPTKIECINNIEDCLAKAICWNEEFGFVHEADSEPEAIFKVCQYILDNKD